MSDSVRVANSVDAPARAQVYALGFMFDHQMKTVALIRKSKPAWQAGKLNGIGGKVENGEQPYEAMRREFAEETGFLCEVLSWHCIGRMFGKDFEVYMFTQTGDLHSLRTVEEEPIVLVPLKDIHVLRDDMVENLPWLISLAFDCLTDGRPAYVEVSYK